MTKLKSRGAKSSATSKTSGAAGRSQQAFKQPQQKKQWGGWQRGNNRDRDSWGLSYEVSQQKSRPAVTSNFSSYFAPSKSAVEPSNIVELGLLIHKHLVGSLIGKKGKTIWMIRDRSRGANIDFGNDDIFVDRSKDGKWESSPWPEVEPMKYNVCAVSGTKEQAVEAVKVIAELLAKNAQSPQWRLQFLIPEPYVGVFIGKKGSNLKQMKGQGEVTIEIRDEPILLGSNKVSICTFFGSAESMEQTIERTAKWLGDISIRARQDKENY